MSIFRTKESLAKDIHYMALLISRIELYIWNNLLEGDKVLERFSTITEQLHILINTAYILKWDSIINNNKIGSTLNKFITKRFTIKNNSDNNKLSLTSQESTVKSMTLPLVAPLITPSSGVLSPSNKFVNVIKKKILKQSNIKKSYVQASKANISPNIEDILCIKEAFPLLLVNKVGKMIKAKNSSEGQRKSKINMTTRRLL